MNIEQLTKIELAIINRLPKSCKIEEKDTLLRSQSTFEDYRNVFNGYVELSLTDNNEALKRALFLAWYQFAEPSRYSGLSELNDDLVIKVFERVDQLSKHDKLDVELTFMLPFYYQVCEWYFERFNGLEYLLRASKTNSNLWETKVLMQDWKNRGSLGEYWESKSL